VPAATSERTISQTWLRLRGFESGCRLVEEQQLGCDDEAGGDVEAAPHPARVGLDLTGAGLEQVESVEELRRPCLGVGPRVAEQQGEQDEVLPSR
jgi:hypothetical protein